MREAFHEQVFSGRPLPLPTLDRNLGGNRGSLVETDIVNNTSVARSEGNGVSFCFQECCLLMERAGFIIADLP